MQEEIRPFFKLRIKPLLYLIVHSRYAEVKARIDL
jgi:hypothetical protein